MRVSFVLLYLTVAAAPASAAQLRLPLDSPARYDAYSSQQIAEPWAAQRAVPALQEKPVGELIATRLGLVEGSAELFRYRVENAPSDATTFDGVVDGGGIKLKLTW